MTLKMVENKDASFSWKRLIKGEVEDKMSNCVILSVNKVLFLLHWRT